MGRGWLGLVGCAWGNVRSLFVRVLCRVSYFQRRCTLLGFGLDTDLDRLFLGTFDLIFDGTLFSYEEDAIGRVFDLFRAGANGLFGGFGGYRFIDTD